jgi:hypothetical protein
MKAVRYYGPQDVRVEHIAEPVAGNGQVKIKVSYSYTGYTSPCMWLITLGRLVCFLL